MKTTANWGIKIIEKKQVKNRLNLVDKKDYTHRLKASVNWGIRINRLKSNVICWIRRNTEAKNKRQLQDKEKRE